jgi:hypothetical protein
LTFTRFDWLWVGGAGLAAAAGFLLLRFRTLDPETIERRRRERINRIGRLAQGEILEILERDDAAAAVSRRARFGRLFSRQMSRPRGELILYRYTISGVSYETADELAGTPAAMRLPMPGQIATIKYDPSNPSNSILVAEGWLTPRTSAANPVPLEKGK